MTTPIWRLAEELAYQRYPDQTVQDEPDLIDLMVPDARAALTAAIGSVEETARVLHPEAFEPWEPKSERHARIRGLQMAGRMLNAKRHAERLHAWLLGAPETKEAGRG